MIGSGTSARRLVVGIAVGLLASLAIGVPQGASGHCAYAWCFVETRGTTTHGIVDDYWRDRPQTTAGEPAGVVFVRAAPTPASSNVFDWSDFGIGLGVAFTTMLVLAGLGAGILGFRLSRTRPREAEAI